MGASQPPEGMSTSLFHFIRAAMAPDGKGLLMEGTVQPPSAHGMLSAGFPAGGGSNSSRACPTPVLPGEVQGLVTGSAPLLHALAAGPAATARPLRVFT